MTPAHLSELSRYEQWKYRRAMKRLRRNLGIPDSVTDEQIHASSLRIGLAAKRASMTMEQAGARVAQVAKALRETQR